MKEKWKETALKCSTVSVVSGRWRKSELCGACLRVSLMIVYIPKLGMHRYIGQTSAQPDLRLVDHSLLCKQECIYWRECFLIFFSQCLMFKMVCQLCYWKFTCLPGTRRKSKQEQSVACPEVHSRCIPTKSLTMFIILLLVVLNRKWDLISV